ncbi:MAG: IPTL-CTERM sorting domain-containing protein [Candidatus Eisenbacteria bacterium]|nr:IPTL-CTERM sorting domain-containing protein [Candidatus Eisenbacteria bacterium]
MALVRRAISPLAAVVLTASLLLLAGIAQAANTRYLQVNGDALLGDNGKITIETFNKPDITGSRSGRGGGTLNVLMPVSCTITGPSNCIQTATKLRDSLDVQLSPSFVATLVGGGSSVQIDYTGGGAFNFTMLSDNIPRQSVMEVDAGAIPTLSEWGLIFLSLLLLCSGAWYLRRRTAAGPWGTA